MDLNLRVAQIIDSSGALVVVVVFVVVVKYSRRAPGYFIAIGDKAPPAARDSREVALA